MEGDIPMKVLIAAVLALSSLAAGACPQITGSFQCAIHGSSSSVEMEARTVKTPQNSFRYWLLESEIEAANLPVRRTSEGMGFILVSTSSCKNESIDYKLEQINADTNSKIGELNMTIEKTSDEEIKIHITNTGDEDQFVTCKKVSGRGR